MGRHFPFSSCTNPAPKPGNRKRESTSRYRRAGPCHRAGPVSGKVEGNTYEDNGGVVKIEFKSEGKAYLSAGPATTTCTYSESGKTATWICVSDKTVFTLEDDGALSGPPDGLLTRLTKKQ
jgi:hypothetical protein